MINSRLEEVFREKIIYFIGAGSHQVSFPVDIVSYTSLFVLADHENESSPDRLNEPLNTETFFIELDKIGIAVDGSAITTFHMLIRKEYVTESEGDYALSSNALIYTEILKQIFPEISGNNLLAYIIQTNEEIVSGRKTEEDAAQHFDQMLLSHGRKLDVTQLTSDQKKFYKTVVSDKGASNDGGNASLFQERELKREKVLNALSKRMKKMGELPVLPFNETVIQEITELDDRGVSKILDVALTDLSIASNILKYVNTSPKYRSDTAISTISQALLDVGHDEAVQLLNDVLLVEKKKEHQFAKGVALGLNFSFLSGLVTTELMDNIVGDGGEDVVVCTMFFHFGQILVMHYLPEVYAKILAVLARKGGDRNSAAREVMGMSFANAGSRVLSEWGFPFHIMESMKTVSGKAIGASKNSLLSNLPYAVNEVILAAGRNFNENDGKFKEVVENLGLPKNDVILAFESGWSKLFDFFSSKQYVVHRREFLANAQLHFSS